MLNNHFFFREHIPENGKHGADPIHTIKYNTIHSGSSVAGPLEANNQAPPPPY